MKIPFNDFLHKHDLKNEAISNIAIYQLLSSLGLSDVGIYLGDGPFSSDSEILNFNLSKRTNWVVYVKKNVFDSYGCVCPKKLSNYITKRSGYCFYSAYKIQGLTNNRDSYCASYCWYIMYLTNVVGIGFKSAALNIYY